VPTDRLSQSEIDRILDSEVGRTSATGAAPRPDVQIYDFRRPHRVSKEHHRSMEAIYGRLAKSLEGWLMGRVRGHVEVRVETIEQLSFGEFTLSLTTPSCSYLFDVTDSGGQQAVIDFGQEFAFFLVDRLFGGSGTPTVPDRPLTPMERMAVRVVSERVATLVTEVWNDQVEIGLTLDGWESSPEMIQAANREDPVLVASFGVTTGGLRSLFSVCLPFAVLEKFFAGAGPKRENTVIGSERERESNRESTEHSLRAMRVDIAVRLPEFRLSMREIAALKAGMVVRTGVASDSEVEVLVNEQRRFRAAPGRIRQNLAARVASPIPQMVPGAQPEIASDPLS
jgi:flagellar motor switch protein FliM